MSWPDALRYVIFGLFGFTIGETAWIVRQYFGVIVRTRRLLPTHVGLISVAFLGFETEAVYQNAKNFGDPATYYVPLNLTLFSLAYVALVMIRVHITRKRNAHTEIQSLLHEKDGLP